MEKNKKITILGIETSCDDTGIALISFKDKKVEILSNIVSSQTKIHEQYGGVFPMLAKREHQKNSVPVLMAALREAGLLKTATSRIPAGKLKTINFILGREQELLKQIIPFLEKYEKPDVDYIAVTNGPGLEPCLWVGTNFAKVLAYYWNLPLIPANHIEAHILVNFLQETDEIKTASFKKQNFPAICLIVSGGHTQLVLMKNLNKYELIGETRDDAAGECFDKTARVLGLGYPGGPAIAAKAAEFKGQPKIKLPRPMANSKDYDFSFSGLKTAVLYDYLKNKEVDKAEMAHEIQQAIIDILLKKTINAAINYKAKAIILGGGVTANQELRKQLAERINNMIPNTKLMTPEAKYSTDNGLMIAITAYFKLKLAVDWKKVEVDANLRIK